MAIELKGLEDVLEALNAMVEPSRMIQALQKATLLVEAEAVKKAPKGDIQQSITSKLDGFQGIVYTPLHYAPYVEYGTGIFAEGGKGRQEVPWVYVEGSTKSSNGKTVYTEETARQTVAILRSEGLPAHMTSGQKPKPYMRPALDENRDKIVEILKEGLFKK